MGYPPHWLSEILSNTLKSPLDTRATPPSSVPVHQADTTAMFDLSRKLKKFSTKPYMAEFTTLTAMWLPVLQLGLLEGHKLIPQPKCIRKYSITFDHVDFDMGFETAFVLVFVNMNYEAPVGPLPLRALLINAGEKAKRALKKPDEVREKGLHVLTTSQFATETKKATFWMREDVTADLMDGGKEWHASIWRVDRWDVVGQPVKLAAGGVKESGSTRY